MNVRELLAKVLAGLTPGDFAVLHCGGGDSLLPKDMRDTTPEVIVPTYAEAERHLCGDDEDSIQSAICDAAELNMDDWIGDHKCVPYRGISDLCITIRNAAWDRLAS
jgi:hypothetical protein